MSVESLFFKDNHWLCTMCGQRQEASDMICAKCLKFKPATFYQNLIHDPENATQTELKTMQKRRELEQLLVSEAEKAGKPMQGSVWFMISNKWYYKWKCFIQNQVNLNELYDNEEWAASISLSCNSEIGVLPPDLISNEEDLFEEAPENIRSDALIPGKAPKKDMRLNIDYKAVNAMVWYIF